LNCTQLTVLDSKSMANVIVGLCCGMTVLDCSADAPSLQDTSSGERQDLPFADQDSTRNSDVTVLPEAHSHPPTVFKKRGRGRPPLCNLSDKRKAQLNEVIVLICCVLCSLHCLLLNYTLNKHTLCQNFDFFAVQHLPFSFQISSLSSLAVLIYMNLFVFMVHP